MAELLLIISNSSGLSFEYLNGAMQFTTKNPTVGSTDTVFCWCCEFVVSTYTYICDLTLTDSNIVLHQPVHTKIDNNQNRTIILPQK